jgi:hypothetical protein
MKTIEDVVEKLNEVISEAKRQVLLGWLSQEEENEIRDGIESLEALLDWIKDG